MLNKRPLPISDFLSDLNTFDIVLMHGIFPSSLITEEIQSSNWSHVGLVVVAKDLLSVGIVLPNIDPETRLFWESNGLSVTDVILHTPKDGVQLVQLKDRISFDMINKWDSAFASRKLRLPRTLAMYQTLKEVIQEVHSANLPVTKNGQPGDLENFQMGRFLNQPVVDGTFFCSQLTAYTYMSINILTTQYVNNSYAPVDFSESLDVSFLNEAWLNKETFLDVTTV